MNRRLVVAARRGLRRARFGVLLGCAFCLGSFACATSEDAKRLDAEVSRVQSEIEDATADQARYSAGSLVQALASLRVAALKQSLAMLEQKRSSYLFHVAVNYTVDGRPYSPPADKAALASELDARLAESQAAFAVAKQRANDASAELRTSALAEVETRALTIAQLEYQRDALRFGFPVYASSVPSNQSASQWTSTAIAGAAQTIDVPAERLKTALGVTLVEKAFVPNGSHSDRLGDKESFRFRYHNGGPTEIRAFKGVLVLSDLDDREFFRLSLTSEVPIEPGGAASEDRSIALEPASKKYDRLVQTGLENTKARFEPHWIAFSDGSTLGDSVAANDPASKADLEHAGRKMAEDASRPPPKVEADDPAIGRSRATTSAAAHHMHEGRDGFMRCDDGYKLKDNDCVVGSAPDDSKSQEFWTGRGKP